MYSVKTVITLKDTSFRSFSNENSNMKAIISFKL